MCSDNCNKLIELSKKSKSVKRDTLEMTKQCHNFNNQKPKWKTNSKTQRRHSKSKILKLEIKSNKQNNNSKNNCSKPNQQWEIIN